MLTKEMFRKELRSMKDEYRMDNKWVQEWRKWNDDSIMDEFIDAAYNLYAATAKCALKLTVLGDTEIRSMPELLKNFGLMSAAGVQEDKDIKMVNDLEQHRKQVAMGTTAGLKGRTKVLGGGSILGDKMWTPILNDSLMLGSIQSNQDFYLGLNTKEKLAWKGNGFNSNVANKTAKFGGAVANSRNKYQSNWLSFFRQQPQMIWAGPNPRVFARELLALKFFGYKPVYSAMGLAFTPVQGKRIGPPGFRIYTTALRNVGFFDNDKDRVMSAISEFLFDDKNALL